MRSSCRAVFKTAVRKMAELGEQVLERNDVKGSEVDCFIPHQANRRIITATAERLGMPEERVVINIGEYGNTTGATIPLAMGTAREQGRLKRGNLVLLASFGGGYTVGATLLRSELRRVLHLQERDARLRPREWRQKPWRS